MPDLRRVASAIFLLACASLPAAAEMPAEGMFHASKACPALQSIRKNTNPGEVMTQAGGSYRIIAKNQKKPTYFRLEMPGAAPLERWVPAACGSVEQASAAAPAPAPKDKTSAAPAAQRSASYVLAITWQPAFCEGSSRKRECRSQTGSRFDATHFTLHGLWPQPGTNIYCGVSSADRQAATGGRWADLPRLALSLATQREVDKAMPGSQSFLDRYEWTKHGTCMGGDAEAYYQSAFRVLSAINGSPVQQLFAGNIGREVTARDIRDSFDQAFGPGAGERVRVACRDDGGRRLISEITIGLRGDVGGGGPVPGLILASSPTDAGCPSGVVDPVGLQ